MAVARAREQDSGMVGRPALVWREDWRKSDGISAGVTCSRWKSLLTRSDCADGDCKLLAP